MTAGRGRADESGVPTGDLRLRSRGRRRETGAIGSGALILLGVEQGDAEAQADLMAEKIARLRVFADENGRMNRSVLDTGGGVLVVSNFTLCGNCRHGRRQVPLRRPPGRRPGRCMSGWCGSCGK